MYEHYAVSCENISFGDGLIAMHDSVMTNVLAIDADFVKLNFCQNKKEINIYICVYIYIYISSVDCVADASRAEPNRAG
jgi:hypothetical protein